ncbi:MAG TPA: KTSC domain-containing protein [Burkholderiales bacterium]|nr:KTSC domain-containing protein [Burkholderiales bacterium]
MERKRVNSSKIRAVGYDPKSQILEIEFSDGRVNQYHGVSPEVYRQFMAAPSPTSFFEDKIDESFPSSRIR